MGTTLKMGTVYTNGKVKPRKMSDKIQPKGLQDPGMRWFYRYLTKYVAKTHYPLIALHVFTFVPLVVSFGFLFRGLRSPDVGVIKNKTSWENIPPSVQFPFYSPRADYYKKLGKDIPKYE